MNKNKYSGSLLANPSSIIYYLSVLSSRPVVILTFPCLGLILVLSCVKKVYGTFIFVPGLDLGTSGLEPNIDIILINTLKALSHWRRRRRDYRDWLVAATRATRETKNSLRSHQSGDDAATATCL